MISPEGVYSNLRIGNQLNDNLFPQFVVPGGYYFASCVQEEHAYALAGCTVSPGFDFADFELMDRTEMITRFPQHREVIEKFTRI